MLLLFSCSVVSDSSQAHELQLARLPCPSLSPGICSNSRSLSRWYHPTISLSVSPFSFWPQSFPASWSFSMSWLLESGGQSTGALVSASALPMNIQGWFPFGLTGLISLLSKGLSRVFPSTIVRKPLNSWVLSLLYGATLTSVHDYWKTIALTRRTFVGKVMSLLFNMLSRLAIDFLPRSKHFLLSRLQSPSAVILEPKKIVCHCFHCFPIYLPWSDGTGCHDLHFLNIEC